VCDFLEALGGRSTDAMRRRARVVELRVGLLERLQLVEQPVVLGVLDLRIVEDVVPVVVVLEQAAQLGGALGGLGGRRGRHLVDRIGAGFVRNASNRRLAGGLPLPPPAESRAVGCRPSGTFFCPERRAGASRDCPSGTA
jgi:hypothetical protein